MSHAWDQTHRRYQLAHAIADDVARSGLAVLDGRATDIEREFGDLGGLLLYVQSRWYLAVDAALDMVLETGADDTKAEIAKAWSDLASTHRPYRTLLDGLSTHPVLVEGENYHRRRLLDTVGVDPHALAAATTGGRRRFRRGRGTKNAA